MLSFEWTEGVNRVARDEWNDLVGAATLGAGRYDGSNAAAMAQLSGLAGGPDEIYRSMVAQLGIDAGSAYGRAELQGRIVVQVITTAAREGAP